MAFNGKFLIPSKMYIAEEILEGVYPFKYLGYNLSYLEEQDINYKIQNFNRALRIINKFSDLMKSRYIQD